MICPQARSAWYKATTSCKTLCPTNTRARGLLASLRAPTDTCAERTRRPQQRSLFRRRLQELERAHQIIAHGHHRTSIVELTAVVRGAEEGHHLPAREELVSIL